MQYGMFMLMYLEKNCQQKIRNKGDLLTLGTLELLAVFHVEMNVLCTRGVEKKLHTRLLPRRQGIFWDLQRVGMSNQQASIQAHSDDLSQLERTLQ